VVVKVRPAALTIPHRVVPVVPVVAVAVTLVQVVLVALARLVRRDRVIMVDRGVMVLVDLCIKEEGVVVRVQLDRVTHLLLVFQLV
jgi:hypothetical protein